jgi:hypothetical protein
MRQAHAPCGGALAATDHPETHVSAKRVTHRAGCRDGSRWQYRRMVRPGLSVISTGYDCGERLQVSGEGGSGGFPMCTVRGARSRIAPELTLGAPFRIRTCGLRTAGRPPGCRRGPDQGGPRLESHRRDRIEHQEMGGRFGAADHFVDVDKLQVWSSPAGAQGESPHAAESVDAYSRGHDTDYLPGVAIIGRPAQHETPATSSGVGTQQPVLF